MTWSAAQYSKFEAEHMPFRHGFPASMARVAALAFLPAWLLIYSADAAYCPDHCDQNTIRPSEIPSDAPRFRDYPAKIVSTLHPVKPDALSNAKIRLFRTMIRKGAANGANFAGHYTLIGYGCGADCSSWVIADALTGHVYQLPNMSTVESTNVDPVLLRENSAVLFHLDSRLVMVVGDINEDSKLRGISYLEWNGSKLNRVRFVPHPLDYDPHY